MSHDPHSPWPREYAEYFRLFNIGDYFEAHEVLEDLWVIEVEPLKTYYKGLIQAAVALCHWERGNPSGARKLYRSARAYLSIYPEQYEGFAVGEFLHWLDGEFAHWADATPEITPPFPAAVPTLLLKGSTLV